MLRSSIQYPNPQPNETLAKAARYGLLARQFERSMRRGDAPALPLYVMGSAAPSRCAPRWVSEVFGCFDAAQRSQNSPPCSRLRYPFVALREILSFDVPRSMFNVPYVPPCEKTRRARANQKQGITRRHSDTELDEDRLSTDSRVSSGHRTFAHESIRIIFIVYPLSLCMRFFLS